MSFNIKIFLFCPIPEEQKPINEYISYKKKFFNQLLNKIKKKEKTNFIFSTFFIFYFLNCFFNQKILYEIPDILITFIFSFISFNIIILSNYLVLREISLNLNKSRLFYEEASWFDGQLWEKPFETIKNDRLLKTQNIKSNLEKSKNVLINLNIVLSIFFLLKILIINENQI